MATNSSNKAARILLGLAGLFLIYFGYLLYANIPQRSDLIWVSSSDVKEVRYSQTRRSGPSLCIITRDLRCLSLNSQELGYAKLFAATKNGTSYSVAYIEDRDIFSDGPERYNIVYAVIVNGVTVTSFESRVKGERYFSIGIVTVGIVLAVLALHAVAQIYSAAKSGKGGRREAAHHPGNSAAQRAVYLAVLACFVIFMVAYGKEHLLAPLNLLPAPLGAAIYAVVGFVPVYILLLFAFKPEIVKGQHAQSAQGAWVERLWHGEASPLASLLGYNLSGALFIVMAAQFLYSRLAHETSGRALILGFAFALFGIGYHIVSVVGALRNASRYPESIAMTLLARLGVSMSSALILAGLVLTYLGMNLFS